MRQLLVGDLRWLSRITHHHGQPKTVAARALGAGSSAARTIIERALAGRRQARAARLERARQSHAHWLRRFGARPRTAASRRGTGVTGSCTRRACPRRRFEAGHGEARSAMPETFSTEAPTRDVIHAVEVQHGVRADPRGPQHGRPRGHGRGRDLGAGRRTASRPSSSRTRTAGIARSGARSPRRPRRSRNLIENLRVKRTPSRPSRSTARPAASQGWLGSRVRPIAGGGYWSDVNPQAQRLARAPPYNRRASDFAGTRSLRTSTPWPFPIHLWVAGPEAFGGTVTDWDGPDGIRDMQKSLPSVQVREFVEGGHSIHNTATEKFMEALLAVVDDAAKAANERPWPAAAGSSWNPFRRWRSWASALPAAPRS